MADGGGDKLIKIMSSLKSGTPAAVLLFVVKIALGVN